MAKSFLSGQNVQKGKGAKLPWKKIVLVVAALVTAFGLGVGLFLFQNYKKENQENNSASSSQQDELGNTIEQDNVVLKAESLSAGGDYDGAQALLKKAIEDEPNKEQAQYLVMQQAVNALNAKKHAESLAYAREAIELEDNFSANQLAGRAAEAAGELNEAEKYYRIALEKFYKANADPQEERLLKEDIERVSQ